MRLTKNTIIGSEQYTPVRRLRGGPTHYFVFYNPHGKGFAFTEKEILDASERFEKLDDGDANFPHRWTFWRWIVGVVNGRS
jgi:hypothetical protein